jgi:pimeloyl-ACP methyl ester carboxylesterase
MTADASLTTTTGTTASADGTRIAYESVGSGPALVLVDGAMVFRDFGPARPLAAALADSFTVYSFDRRGRGGSADTLPYAVEREIEDLRAVIDAAGGNAFVMGQSSGAGLVLEAAAAGVPMRKLAAYEAPYVGLRPDKNGTPRDFHGELQRLIADDKRGAAVSYFLVKMVGAPSFVPVMMHLMPKAWKQLKSTAHTLPYDAAVMGRFEPPTERLATIRVPSLVMAGSKSKQEMLDAERKVTDAIPDARLEVLDGQTHQVSPKAIAPVLKEFFLS